MKPEPLNPELLDSFLIISKWRPSGIEIAEGEGESCTRCGDREATVSICVPCLLEVVAKMSNVQAAEPVVEVPVSAPRKKPHGAVLELFLVTLFSLGVLVTGSLLNEFLH